MNIILSQSFHYQDIYILILLFFVELLLSSDNILAISLILQKIEESKRKLALTAGVWSSIFFRAGIVFSASILFLINPLKVIAGLYLLYICISHVRGKRSQCDDKSKHTSFWKGVFLIELTDLLFALDSIFIALGILSFFYKKEMVPHKIWIAFVAGALGVIFLRFLATRILKVLQKYPVLEKASYLIIGWIGVKLVFIGFDLPHNIPYFNPIFVCGIAIIVLFSFFSTKSPQK